eukprot:GFUD01004167.1.p1 GENE.GFUD01004167.1~~GFUD01004167.1.p1  ORF type:complete len:695 (+),score=85.89 GFUD01004167.1:112-2196(+)
MSATLLLLFLYHLYGKFIKGYPQSDCCAHKDVGGIRYDLVSAEDTTAFGCTSNCIFEQEDEPGSRICFKSGSLPYHCVEDDPEWMAVRIIPGGHDHARGHYPEHAIDTDLINRQAKENIIDCPNNTPFRSINGSCNNFKYPMWGASGSPYQRFISPPAYDDLTTGTPRGGNPSSLPSPRKISAEFHDQLNSPDMAISNLFYQFGQFISHDMGLTPEVNLDMKLSGGFNNTACATEEFRHKKQCFNIDVTNDTFYKNVNLPTYPWLGFARTLPNKYSDTKDRIRQQINMGTGFLDASITYGFNKAISDQLRTNKSGKLIQGADNLLPTNIPLFNPNFASSTNYTNLVGGDPRANMHPWLLSVQTMFLREHNRLAKQINDNVNVTDCNDECIFQNARRIVIAEYQNIIFSEFLPLVLGNDTMTKYDLYTNTSPYNKNTNPTVYNGFQTAAMRFGHSMVHQGGLALQNLTSGGNLSETLRFRYNFFNDTRYHFENGSGYSQILGGMSIQGCQHFDRYVTKGLTDQLYNVRGLKDYGDDLASRNIQRGRDHGLPGYLRYRKFCGLEGHDDIGPTNWKRLLKIYGNPEGIDLWTGGLAETPAHGSIVGPLFKCLLGKQYHNSKFGDRFFFTHKGQAGSFTKQQLATIRARTMRDIVCQNSESPMIRKHAMEIRPDEKLIPCNEKSINELNGKNFVRFKV